jgi:O-acetylserine/cysteine efflux transporter
MGPLDLLAALAVVALWGLNFVVVKLGVADMPPLLLTTLRFTLAAVLLVPFLRPRREHLKGILILSVTFGTVHFGLLFVAIKSVDAATAAIIVQLGAPFSTLGAVLFLGETMGWRRWLGLALAFSGVIIVAGDPNLGAPLPIVLLLLSALGWAVSNLVVKTIRGCHPLTMTGWLTLFAAPQTLALSLILEGNPLPHLAQAGWAGWGAVAYTAILASIVAHSLWYHLLNRHPVSRVAPFALMAPITGICAGILLLGEPATLEKLAGGVVTLTGVTLIEIWGRRAKPRPKT